MKTLLMMILLATQTIWTFPPLHVLEHFGLEKRGSYSGPIVGTVLPREDGLGWEVTTKDDIDPALFYEAIENGVNCNQAGNFLCNARWPGSTASQAQAWKGAAGKFCAAECSGGADRYAFVAVIQ